MQTVTHRHEPPAPVVNRTRNDVAHDRNTEAAPREGMASRAAEARPDRPPKGPRRNRE